MRKERFPKQYRLIWTHDGVHASWEPPLTPEQFVAATLGQMAGTQVDAVFMNCCVGYQTLYPSRLPDLPFYGQDCDPRVKTKHRNVHHWRTGKTVAALIESGHDPLALLCQEARRLGMDLWADMHMNDWHHFDETYDAQGRMDIGQYNSWAGPFFTEHPEYWIGRESVENAPADRKYGQVVQFFQDFAHPEVREFRRAIVEEVCTRYDVDGFQLDLMRIPCFFKPAEIERNTPLMTAFIREVRATLDRIGEQKDRRLELAVRVPLTIEGALNTGLDVRAWISEGLVDMLSPTPFFMSYLDADIHPYADLVRDTPCLLYPAIEESYACGYTAQVIPEWVFGGTDCIQPVTVEMARAVAMHYWQAGAHGIALHNWEGTWHADYRNHPALLELGDPDILKHKDKRYVVTRQRARTDFPIHDPPAPLPIALEDAPARFALRVSDDLPAAAERLEEVSLWLYIRNLTSFDEIEVRLKGTVLKGPANPMKAGMFIPRGNATWLKYDMAGQLPCPGLNEVLVTLLSKNEDLTADKANCPIVLSDTELEVRYCWPDGEWRPPRGWLPRT